jgi:type VI secretion system FHA domain protein
VLEAIAAAAGLPEGSLSQGNPLETATEIGRALHVLGEELSGLLQARAVARRSVRSGQVTMIGREDNNPLKFMPTPDQALSAMFGPPRPGFQRGSTAIRAAFADIKRHQYATHAAIQPALARLLDDLAPETIEARVKTSGLLSNRRARAWETFVERWDAKAQAHENGMLDVFLTYFAEAYDGESGG